MPKGQGFASQKQRGLFYAKAKRGEIPTSTVKKWERETPKGKKLPERKKSAAWEAGFLLGVVKSSASLEGRILALDRAVREIGIVALPELAKHAGYWLLEQEKRYPGFIKAACEDMEKAAQDAKTPAPASERGKAALGAVLSGGGFGTIGKIYSFLKKYPWVLALGGLGLGGLLGGGTGAALGGLAGGALQYFLPQLAAWGIKQYKPLQKILTPEEMGQLGGADPFAAARRAVGQKAWGYAKERPVAAGVQAYPTLAAGASSLLSAIPGARAFGAAVKGTVPLVQQLGPQLAERYGPQIKQRLSGLFSTRPTGAPPPSPARGAIPSLFSSVPQAAR